MQKNNPHPTKSKRIKGYLLRQLEIIYRKKRLAHNEQAPLMFVLTANYLAK